MGSIVVKEAMITIPSRISIQSNGPYMDRFSLLGPVSTGIYDSHSCIKSSIMTDQKMHRKAKMKADILAI